ncbi:hypothetical protein ONZ45_g7593 [Pleurotus djamor]|nr:hypothetical protein ONZ45_g7593 [Pleurotus djamor]
MPSDQVARGGNGKLRDADDINFYHSEGDSEPISGPGVVKASGRGHRKKNTKRLDESLLVHHQDDDGQPVDPKKKSKTRSARRKHRKRSKHLPCSDPEDDDYTTASSEHSDGSGDDGSDDDGSGGNVSNGELASVLPSKIAPKTARIQNPLNVTSSSTKRRLSDESNQPAASSKKNRVTVEEVSDDEEESQPVQVAKSTKKNPVYIFYDERNTPWNGEEAMAGCMYYKCRHGTSCEQKRITKKMNSNLNGLTGHLKTHHPFMYRLFKILKDRKTPPTSQELEIASGRKKLGATELAKFLSALGENTPNIATAVAEQLEKSKGPWSQEHFVGLLLKCIIGLDLPFDTVEKPEFQTMLQYVHHSHSPLSIPGRTTVKKRTMDLEKDVVKSTAKMFKKLRGKVAISLDAWTSSNHYAFLAIVAHYVTNEGKLEERLIDFRELDGEHSGENMAEAVWETLTVYGILRKVIAFVMDNASNNNTLMTALEERFKANSIPFSARDARLRCMPHTIHLAALKLMDGIGAMTAAEAQAAGSRAGVYQNAFADNVDGYEVDDEEDLSLDNPEGYDLSSSVTRLRKIIRAVRSSPQRRKSWLKEVSTTLEMAPIGDHSNPVSRALMLILDVRTRWTSTFQMLDRAIKYEESLNVFVFKHDELRELGIKSAEWSILKNLRHWLLLFKEATTRMSTTKFPMISFVHAVFRDLQDSIKSSIVNLPESTPVAVRNALVSAHEKLAEYYFKFDESPFYAWAALLDPRIGLRGLEFDFADDDSLRDDLPEMKRSLKVYLATRYKEIPVDKDKDESHSATAQSSADQAASEATNPLSRYGDIPQLPIDEVEEFWKLPRENFKTCDPIAWWSGRRQQFPRLHQMALDILSIPGVHAT